MNFQLMCTAKIDTNTLAFVTNSRNQLTRRCPW